MGQFCSACSSSDNTQLRENLNKTLISPHFPSITFQFTNSTATKIPHHECVIVDVLLKKPSHQPYFSQLQSQHFATIQSLLNLTKPGQIQVVENPIISIRVKDIIFISLPIWSNNEETCIKNVVDGAIGEAVNTGHKNIIICGFQQSLGIPLNKSTKIILGTVDKYQNNLEKVTFFSDNNATLKYVKEQTQKFDAQAMQKVVSNISDFN